MCCPYCLCWLWRAIDAFLTDVSVVLCDSYSEQDVMIQPSLSDEDALARFPTHTKHAVREASRVATASVVPLSSRVRRAVFVLQLHSVPVSEWSFRHRFSLPVVVVAGPLLQGLHPHHPLRCPQVLMPSAARGPWCLIMCSLFRCLYLNLFEICSCTCRRL